MTYSASLFFTKEAITASASGVFRLERRRLPATNAHSSSKATICSPMSLSNLILVFAASSPIFAPACSMNSDKMMVGANTRPLSSFSKRSRIFVLASGFGGNSRVSRRRVSATLVNDSVSDFHRALL